MEIQLDPRFVQQFPTAAFGFLTGSRIDNTKASPEIDALLTAAEERVRGSFNRETFTDDPRIACWRKAYLEFGVKHRDAKSSIENLYRLVLQGKELRRVNPLVDLYNTVSLNHMLPLGGEDTDRMQGNLRLTFADGSEEPVLLLGDQAPEKPNVGEVIYRDDVGVICRRWNWRESDRVKLTAETKNCLLAVEALPPTSIGELRSATEELASLVQRFCGGEWERRIVGGGE